MPTSAATTATPFNQTAHTKTVATFSAGTCRPTKPTTTASRKAKKNPPRPAIRRPATTFGGISTTGHSSEADVGRSVVDASKSAVTPTVTAAPPNSSDSGIGASNRPEISWALATPGRPARTPSADRRPLRTRVTPAENRPTVKTLVEPPLRQ
ncbi:hypothetical protein ACFQLZ_16515 [Halospeciosus flavus]